ncbi:MAG: hypothetical protein ACKO4T_13685 [Planctomycetaceae bacterium]
MTLDFLDAAFVEHWRTSLTPVVAERPAEPRVPAALAAERAEDARGLPSPLVPRDGVADPPHDDFVGRLLAAAPDEWAALADEVISARSRGRRTVAIVACEPGAGCTTLAAGLVRTLRGRGRHATSYATSCATADAGSSGPTHDKAILVVDGGVWFPPGRINRQRLLIASAGCDAVILVVRSGHEPPPAWSTALEAIGVEPLGAVLSFVPPSPPHASLP